MIASPYTVTTFVDAAAGLNVPNGITTDATKTNLYLSDYGHNVIQKIPIANPSNISIWAGDPTFTSGSADGSPGSFNGPSFITYDGTDLYVSDYNNNMIRKIQ